MSFFEVMVAAITLGVITLPHCLLMCGPVAAMGCSTSGSGHATVRDTFSYLGGRLVGYAAVGSFMGGLGAHAVTAFGVDVVGRLALFALALACVVRAYRVLRPKSEKLVAVGLTRSAPARGASRSLLAVFASLLPRRGLGLGLATAIFPCGALPAAWALSAASGQALSGAAAMSVFALTSTPALLFAVGGRTWLRRIIHAIPRVVQAAAWLAMATILLARVVFVESFCHG